MSDWQKRNRPFRLEKRFEFEAYDSTRDFLDRLGQYSEEVKRFPDISFGKKYVNITIRTQGDDEAADLVDDDYDFSRRIDELLN